MTIQASDFHGIWQLSKWSVLLANGDERAPFGGNVDGYLIYTPDGWVSATLMERERADISQDRRAINTLRRAGPQTAAQKLDAVETNLLWEYFLAGSGYISYGGPFDIDEQSVHHRVSISLIPQWVGTTLSREYVFDAAGDRLTLTAQQGRLTDHLVWERVR